MLVIPKNPKVPYIVNMGDGLFKVAVSIQGPRLFSFQLPGKKTIEATYTITVLKSALLIAVDTMENTSTPYPQFHTVAKSFLRYS